MEQKNKVDVLLFDVSPFYYIAYYGAYYILSKQEPWKKPEELDQYKLMDLTTRFLYSKFENIFYNYIVKECIPLYIYDGVPQRKLELLKNHYKEGRTQRIPKETKQELKKYLAGFPGYHISNPEEEADDLIATLRYNIKLDSSFNKNFIIYSKDNDLLQLADWQTTVIDPTNQGGVKNRVYLAKKFDGLQDYKQVILHKICFGDASDNIEGIFKGKRRKPIIEEIKKMETFKQFLTWLGDKALIQKAIDLASVIKLKEDLPYNIRFSSNNTFQNLNIFQSCKILNNGLEEGVL